MSTWQVAAGGCGGSDTVQTVKADHMALEFGCLVFYTRPEPCLADSEITLAIGVGYWNSVTLVKSEEDS